MERQPVIERVTDELTDAAANAGRAVLSLVTRHPEVTAPPPLELEQPVNPTIATEGYRPVQSLIEQEYPWGA